MRADRPRRRTPGVETVALVAVDIVLVLAVARLLRGALQRVRQPPVMAEVLAGIVLGASVLGALPGDPSGALFTPEATQVLKILGQVAAAAYLFRAGATADLQALRRCGRPAAAVGVASFLVPFAAGAAVAVALTGPPAFVLFLGTALAVTAFPVLTRIVDERGLRETRPGRIAVAAAAAQELAVWPLLAVALALDGGTGAAPALAAAVAAVVGVVVLARRVPARLALAGLALAATATHLAGLHVVLGAFLYGVALPAAPRAAALAILDTRPAAAAQALTLPLFFALPALRVDLSTLTGGAGLVAVILVVAVTAKLGSATLAARAAGLPRDEALTIGTLMNARGLVELVVLSIGLEAGLIDDRLFAALVVMALVTTFATGPLLARRPRAGRLSVAWR